MSILSTLGPWGWLTAAAVLLIAEIMVPGIFLLWLGIAALIVGGAGTIAVDDTIWRVTGADAPAGSRIKVTHIDGATVHVERVDD